MSVKDSINVSFFPALNGDSFLLNIGLANILIDGGYVNTYHNFIRPALLEIHKRGEKLDLIVVSHIDGDHISGVNKLLEENNNSKIVDIGSIWHNSYRHLQFNENDFKKFESSTLKSVEDLKILPLLKEDSSIVEKDVSAKKGSTLARLIREGKYDWNTHFNGAAVSFQNEEVTEGNLSFKLLCPNIEKLNRLKAYWLKELYKLGYVNDKKEEGFIDDAFEFVVSGEKEILVLKEKSISAEFTDFEKLADGEFDEDDAPANGSSISFILQSGNLKILFLGDSHPSTIIESLKLHYAVNDFPLFFDAIKISHHGSAQNTNSELLKMIDSKKFLISTNGKSFNHPDIETIARIVSRKTEFKRTLYFNYPLDIHTRINVHSLKEKYNYECIISDGTALNITLNETDN